MEYTALFMVFPTDGRPAVSARFDSTDLRRCKGDFRAVLDGLFWKVCEKKDLDYSSALFCEAIPFEEAPILWYIRLPSNALGFPESFLPMGNWDEAYPILDIVNTPLHQGAKLNEVSFKALEVLRWLSKGMSTLITGDYTDDQFRFAVGFFANGAGKPYRNFLGEEKWAMLTEKARVALI